MYEGSLCVCCMSTDDLIDLKNEGIYLKMLSATLNIQLHGKNTEFSICECCITKLKECLLFKRQILKSISILTSIDVSKLVTLEDRAILELRADGTKQKNTNVLHSDECYDDKFEESKYSPHRADIAVVEDIVPKKKRRAKKRLKDLDKIPEIDEKELKCKRCGEEFKSRGALRIHYNTHIRNYVCEICDKGFITYKGLSRHEKCHKSGPFPCSECDQLFSKMNTLQSHKRLKHSSTLPFKCSKCDKRFETSTRRLHHYRKAHESPREPDENGDYWHSDCISRCPTRIKHKETTQDGVSAIRCNYCLRSFKTKSALCVHIKIHNGDKRFVCKLCNKTFVQKISLKLHIGSHMRRREYSGEANDLMAIKKGDGSNLGLLEGTEQVSEGSLDESVFIDEEELELDESLNGFLLDEEELNRIAEENLAEDDFEFG